LLRVPYTRAFFGRRSLVTASEIEIKKRRAPDETASDLEENARFFDRHAQTCAMQAMLEPARCDCWSLPQDVSVLAHHLAPSPKNRRSPSLDPRHS
jgi:hypothetical protein